MTGLTSHTAYVVEISLDPTFPANETMTDTGWTIEPDVVRMGIRKVTETEATVTAVMDHPNGKDYGLGCQSQLADVDGYWSPVTSTPMDGYIGSTPMQSLTANEDYEYRCRLQWGRRSIRTVWEKTRRQIHTDTGHGLGLGGDQRSYRRYGCNHYCSLSEHRRYQLRRLPPAQSVSVGGVGSGCTKSDHHGHRTVYRLQLGQ